MNNKLKVFICVFLLLLIAGCIFIAYKRDLQPVKKDSSSVTQKEELKKVESKKLSLIMVGDCLIHESVYNAAKQSDGSYDFTSMISQIKPIVQNYDLAFYNQESILGGADIGLSSYPSFNSPQEVGDAMLDAGFNLVSLANNHTLDRGTEALDRSLDYWQAKENIYTAGSYASFEQRDNIKVAEKNGITYALLSYTTVTNGLRRPQGQEYYLNVYDEEQVKKDIEFIRDKVDLLMVSMHFGTEYTLKQTAEQEQIAAYLSSLNVDIVIGHHPHVIEPITYIGNTLVIYSLGNFISGQLTTDQLTGVMVGVDVLKDPNDPKIKLENLSAELIYTQTHSLTSSKYEYHVIPYNQLNEEILPDYREHKEKYSEVLKSLGTDINIK